MARKPPTELTEKLRQEICNNVLIGMPPRAAAEQAGVDREEFLDWTRRARKDEEPFAGLLREVKTAELTAQRHLVASVSKAAGRDPKVALQVLALRYPEDWSERGREKASQLDLEARSEEDVKALAARMASGFPLLHWENREELEALIAGLLAEHMPQGPTEEHLVEELAAIVMRRNRLRLAEAAAHRQRLLGRLPKHRETVRAALIHLGTTKPDETVSDALTATDEDTAESLAIIEKEEAVFSRAIEILGTKGKDRCGAALEALGDYRQWWTNALARRPQDYEKKEQLYTDTADELLRYIKDEVLPWYPTRTEELESRPLIREQAFGESFDAEGIEKLSRVEAYLDRKFEVTLDRLFKLRELRLAKAS